MQLSAVTDENTFLRRRGKGPRTISLLCPACGYLQYDVKPDSPRGRDGTVTCARCGFEGEVKEVRAR